MNGRTSSASRDQTEVAIYMTNKSHEAYRMSHRPRVREGVGSGKGERAHHVMSLDSGK